MGVGIRVDIGRGAVNFLRGIGMGGETGVGWVSRDATDLRW